MKLEEEKGLLDTKKIYINNTVGIAQLADGRWIALNHRSTDPVLLRSRELRASWAYPQGYTSKEVENYVRAEKKRLVKEHHKEYEQDAIRMLESRGYQVVGAP